jgi:hemoglobin/transferrin/lactoferrin receptor protein
MRLVVLLTLLVSSQVFAEKLIITSTKIHEQMDTVDGSIGVLENIEERQAQNFTELLDTMTNVNVTSGPRATAEKFQVRGIDSSKILLTIDGAKQNFRSIHNNGIMVSPALLKQVEVMKGPVSSLYGSGALGGVIVFTTKDASDFLRPGQNKALITSYQYAGNNHLNSPQVISASRSKNIEFLASFQSTLAGDAKDGKDNEIPYSKQDQRNFFTKIGTTSTHKHQVKISYESMLAENKEPNNPGDKITERNVEITNYRSRKTLTLNYHLKQESQFAPYLTLYNTVMSVDKDSDETDEQKRNVETTGIDLYNQFKFHGHKLTVGFENLTDIHRGKFGTTKLGNFPDGESNQQGVYTQLQLQFDKWRVTPGLRYDRYQIQSTDSNLKVASDDNLAKKLSLSYDITPTQMSFISYGEGFNAPRIQDMYAFGLHFPGGGPVPNNFFQENTKLKSEKSKTLELGHRGQFYEIFSSLDSIALEAAVFQTKAYDFISRDVDEMGGTTKFANLDKVTLTGGELNAEYMQGHYTLKIGYSQIRSLNEKTKDPLDDTAADEWNTLFSYSFLQNYKLTYHWKHVLEQNEVANEDLKSSGYNLHHLGFIYQPINSNLQGQFRIDNLFNENYLRHATFINSPGRDVRVLLRYIF